MKQFHLETYLRLLLYFRCGGEFECALCCLTTPGLSKDIQCHI